MTMHRLASGKICWTAVYGLALPLLTVGCQHSAHVATTQVVVNVGSTTAVAEVVAPETASPPPTTQEATTTNQETAVVPTSSDQTAPSAASPSAGHGFAQASRDTGHAIANGAREVGTSTVDIFTNSYVGLHNTPPESLTAPVMDVDEAMQVRDWDQVTATYSSGATVAGPVGFRYEPRGGQESWRYQFLDIPLFLGNTALLPFAFAKTPPWKPVEWKAGTIEPTYTGVPPLPPE